MKQTNKIEKAINYEMTRGMLAGYQQAQRGKKFSEQMEDKTSQLKSSLLKIILKALPLKFEGSDNKDDRYYCYGHNHALDDVRKNLEELFNEKTHT